MYINNNIISITLSTIKFSSYVSKINLEYYINRVTFNIF